MYSYILNIKVQVPPNLENVRDSSNSAKQRKENG